MLVSYMASMFLSRRLCASTYVYFASLDDVCEQNELAFLRLCSGSGSDLCAVKSPHAHVSNPERCIRGAIDHNQADTQSLQLSN